MLEVAEGADQALSPILMKRMLLLVVKSVKMVLVDGFRVTSLLTTLSLLEVVRLPSVTCIRRRNQRTYSDRAGLFG